MPLYPSKCCELGSVLRLLLFRCFLLGLTFEPFKELGVRHLWKGLEFSMSKMALYEPFGHLQHKLWSKEGPGVKLAI